MHYTYTVKIRIAEDLYPGYISWLQDHIQGNASRGIRGMMELQHNGAVIFPSAEIHVTDSIPGERLIKVIYYSPGMEHIRGYLDDHAPAMRNDMPAMYAGKVAFLRYIGNTAGVSPIGEPDKQLEQLFDRQEELMSNLASFEVY